MSMIDRVKQAATSAGTELDKRVGQAVEKNRAPLTTLAKVIVVPAPVPDQYKHRAKFGSTGFGVGLVGAVTAGATAGIAPLLAALAVATIGFYAGAKLDAPGRVSAAPPEASEARKDAAE